jgi:hypothetical protein
VDNKDKKINPADVKAGEGRHIIAYANHYWGRGDTGTEALKKCRSEGGCGKIFILDVPKGTTVGDMGGLTYFPPEGKTWDDFTLDEVKAYRSYNCLGYTTVRC